jgi:hypothetical protein
VRNTYCSTGRDDSLSFLNDPSSIASSTSEFKISSFRRQIVAGTKSAMQAFKWHIDYGKLKTWLCVKYGSSNFDIFLSDQCLELQRLRNAFAWYYEQTKRSCNEVTIFQPIMKFYLQQLFAALEGFPAGVNVSDVNSIPLSGEIWVKDESGDEYTALLTGFSDLCVSETLDPKDFISIFELKSPFKLQGCGVHAQKDQLFAELEALGQMSGGVSLGCLTDLNCMAVALRVPSTDVGATQYHISSRVTSPEQVVLLILLMGLGCALTSSEIGEFSEPGAQIEVESGPIVPPPAASSTNATGRLPLRNSSANTYNQPSSSNYSGKRKRQVDIGNTAHDFPDIPMWVDETTITVSRLAEHNSINRN